VVSVCHGHFTATEKAVVFIELETGWVLELVWMFWRRESLLPLLRLEPKSSIVYPSHCTDCAAPYGFEDNTKVSFFLHNEMGSLDWMCLIHDRNSWKVSLKIVISLEVL
jgi:hypothetical protein